MIIESTLCFPPRGDPLDQVLLGYKKRGFGQASTRGLVGKLKRMRPPQPIESDEIRPVWYNIDRLPVDQMWQDSRYWLPLVLTGSVIEATFTFHDDNESVAQHTIRHLREEI